MLWSRSMMYGCVRVGSAGTREMPLTLGTHSRPRELGAKVDRRHGIKMDGEDLSRGWNVIQPRCWVTFVPLPGWVAACGSILFAAWFNFWLHDLHPAGTGHRACFVSFYCCFSELQCCPCQNTVNKQQVVSDLTSWSCFLSPVCFTLIYIIKWLSGEPRRTPSGCAFEVKCCINAPEPIRGSTNFTQVGWFTHHYEYYSDCENTL